MRFGGFGLIGERVLLNNFFGEQNSWLFGGVSVIFGGESGGVSGAVLLSTTGISPHLDLTNSPGLFGPLFVHSGLSSFICLG